MKKLLLIFAVCVMTLMVSCENQQQNVLTIDQDLSNAPAGTLIPDKYIVVLEEKFAKSSAAMAVELSSVYEMEIGHTYTVIHGFSATVKSDRVKALQSDPRVKYIEQEQVFRIPDYTVEFTIHKTTAQTIPWGITRVGGAGNGIGKRAWVIDSGIDLDHPDLTVDVTRSKNFTREKNADDLNGHGTHVAGTIAAKNNDINVVGVAAGATVIAVKVLDRRGSGTTSGVIAGVDYVSANAAPGDVVNMSLGGGISTTLDAAVLNAAAKGIKFAIAAGNESQNANNCSPARVNHTNVVTISAIDNLNKFASFSNFANPPIDYAAPGVNILSLYKDGLTATMSGTSMATPHVAGILLLGSIAIDGYALNDPDGTPDPIARR